MTSLRLLAPYHYFQRVEMTDWKERARLHALVLQGGTKTQRSRTRMPFLPVIWDGNRSRREGGLNAVLPEGPGCPGAPG